MSCSGCFCSSSVGPLGGMANFPFFPLNFGGEPVFFHGIFTEQRLQMQKLILLWFFPVLPLFLEFSLNRDCRCRY